MLTAIWLVPVLGGLAVMALPRRFAKLLAVAVAVAALALTLVAAAGFQPGHRGFQFVERAPWIPQYHVAYFLGVDGVNLWLVALNALVGLVAVLATPLRTLAAGRFLGLLLLMEGAMAGVFLSLDLLLFYVFWEAMLIPAYFLLWLWGEGPRPVRAALKFVLFTLAGSLLMLVGVIGEYAFTSHTTFAIPDLAGQPPPPAVQFGLFALFALAFAIKVPVFPFHSWLPDAYVAAPTPMLLLFAGVMGKTGAYALLRIVVPLFPHPVSFWNWNAVLPVLAVIGIAWGAFLALAQTDIKAIVAYSSISHMGFIVLGVFTFNAQGQQGAVLQMVNHGIIITALFLIVAWISQRAGTRQRAGLAGLATRMPVMAGVFLIVSLAALGLPGLNNFVGEFMTLLGAWQLSPVLAVLGCIGLVLAPVYMLRLFQGMMHGGRGAAPHHGGVAPQSAAAPAGTAVAAPAIDISGGELALLAPLILLMFLLGLYPDLLMRALQQ